MNGLNLQGQRIQSVGDPSSAQDAVTLAYLQNFLNGIRWKDSVRAASTGNLTIASPGASIDGVALSAGDRVLVKNQTTGSENGIYVWNGAAVAMTRATDADSGTELADGTAVFVGEGTTQANTAWVQTANNPVTIGTTATTWSQFGGGGTTYTAGNGIDITGSAISVKLDSSSGLAVSGTGLKVDTAVVVRKFAQNIGTGSLTAIAVNHGLGTRDVTVEVFDNSTFEKVLPDIVHTDANNVTITFAVAPASNAYRVVVHG
ncbi:head decoration protein [Nocardia nova]|uniref:head decoration protein n=1 Tax=Nocardia nova TaxID=37330 RepID=UPI001894BBD6|nr:head decoration protein [Nocardia nova]MBF6277071.1 head decoration protein [Nocardia nova]